MDVIQRLEPVIIEIERERECVCVVAHQAILRALYGYFMKIPLAVSALLSAPPEIRDVVLVGSCCRQMQYICLHHMHAGPLLIPARRCGLLQRRNDYLQEHVLCGVWHACDAVAHIDRACASD